MKLPALLAALVAVALPVGSPAHAQPTFASDAAWLAWADEHFTKSLGGQARAGNGALNGDWEYAVVGAGTTPVSASGQAAWSALGTSHTFRFEWLGGTASLQVGSRPALSAAVAAPAGGAFDLLAVRARANAGQTAAFDAPLVVEFLSAGGAVVGSRQVAAFAGDADAEYRLVRDRRLAAGFRVSGTAQIAGGRGSAPMYEFKVGHATDATTTVPEPGTWALLGSGLAALAGAGALRRRRRDG